MHYSDLRHPSHAFLAELLARVSSCTYSRIPDLQLLHSLQGFLQSFCVTLLSEPSQQSSYQAAIQAACPCHLFFSHEPASLTVLIYPQVNLNFYWEDFLAVFNACQPNVKLAVEDYLRQHPTPNWYVHYGSGLYLLKKVN